MTKVMLVSTFITKEKESGKLVQEIADVMGIQNSMVSKYTQIHRIPSIHVAKNVYLLKNIVLHPYSEQALIYEIGGKIDEQYLCS